MPTIVTLDEGFKTTITTRHHTYHADEPLDNGGTDTAVSPTEMLLGALGSCIAMTAKMYAQRKGWPLENVTVELEMQRFSAKDYPNYEGEADFVHEFREKITFHGPLDDDQRARLLEISRKCPVRRAISTPAFFKEEVGVVQ